MNGGTAPYTYWWSTGESGIAVNNLTSGNYSLSIEDANGCSRIGSFNIESPPLFVATIQNIQPVRCFEGSDGAIEVEASGGTMPYTYVWSNGLSTSSISGLPAGNYSVSVTDANQCVAYELNAEIEAPEARLDIDVSTTDVTCPGGQDGAIQTIVTGGTPDYSWQWADGAISSSIDRLSAGTYFLTVIDQNDCVESQTIN